MTGREPREPAGGSAPMAVVPGVANLAPEHGRLFVTLGVFDGLHLGHAYLLEALVREAAARGARPAVITFDHHPDAVITGSAPPLLLDPAERLERLAAAGVGVTVVHPFDEATRRTPFDAFVRSIAGTVDLAGFLMTPDSAFGLDRGGTPAALTGLGRDLGFDVVVVPSLELDGQPIRSTDIRAAIARGDLASAGRRLGRPYAVVGKLEASGRVDPPMPVAVPPPGRWRVTIGAWWGEARIEASGAIIVDPGLAAGSRVRVVFDGGVG